MQAHGSIEVIWMECEMCGREGAGYVAIVEGAKLKVCEECSKLGKVISEPRGYSEMRGRESGAGEQRKKEEPEMVEDYGRRMKKAMERMGVPLSVIAEKLSEKESYLRRIENEAVMPDEHLARKIERELGIKLFEEGGGKKGGVAVSKKGEGGLSLWDLAEMQKKKKKEE